VRLPKRSVVGSSTAPNCAASAVRFARFRGIIVAGPVRIGANEVPWLLMDDWPWLPTDDRPSITADDWPSLTAKFTLDRFLNKLFTEC
jgi:hypothetical protein